MLSAILMCVCVFCSGKPILPFLCVQHFPKDNSHGFMLLEEHLFQKVSRLCSEHSEDHSFYESYRMEVRITLFTKRMTGYAFDIRGQATINVINSMPCAPNKKVDAGSSNFLWKPLLKDEKTIHKMNDFKYQISCVWHIASLLINICVKRWEFQNLVLYNYILIESKFYYKFSWRSKTAKEPREYFLENSSC